MRDRAPAYGHSVVAHRVVGKACYFVTAMRRQLKVV